MAFNLQSGYGLGAGADALQEQLRTLFNQAKQNQDHQIELKRLAIERQRADDERAYRQMQQAAQAEAKAADIKAKAQTGALRIAGTMKPGQDVSDETDTLLSKGDLGDAVQRTGRVATRNISGVADTSGPAPRILGLASTENAGLAPKKTYLGTADQQQKADDERQLQALINDPGVPENVRSFLKIRSAVPGGAVPADLFKPEKPATQPVMRVNPRTGKMEQIGEAPQGAHFVSEPAPIGAGQGTLSATAEANLTNKLAADWQKVSAPAREMDRQFSLMQTGLKRFREGDKNGGAQAVLVTFQKVLDPTSVVRESEYARSAEGVSLLQRIQGYAERLKAGGAGVPEAALQEMVNTAQQFTANSRRTAEGQRKRIAAFADKYHIPHELVFDDAPASPAQAAASGSGIKSIVEIK